MESPVVKEMFNLSLKPMLMSLDSTTIAKINQSLGGAKNIHAEANKVYLKHVHMMTQAHYSETGEWPKYHQMLKIAQSAVEVTNNFVLPLTDIRNLGAARQSLQTGATPASPASAASAPASAPPSKTLPVPDKSPLTPEQSAVLRRRTNVQRPNL